MAAEYTGAIGVFGLIAYALFATLAAPGTRAERARRLGRIAGWVALGAAPFLIALMAYHQSCFGGPFESGYKHLADTGYQPWHLGGFLGIKVPSPTAFGLSFFSPLRGFFMLAPFLLLALPGLWLQLRASRGDVHGRALFWLEATILAGYAYFTSSFAYDSWGWTTGPRHLTPLVPFLLLPVALCLERLRAMKTPWLLGAAAGLCAASMVVTGAVSLVNYIPDVASNALFGIAVPLFREGYLPPSALLFVGLTNPGSGAFLLVLLGAALVLGTGSLLWSPGRTLKAWLPGAGAALATCAAFLFLLSALTRHDDGDVGAAGHLHSVWLAPPGVEVPFWPKR